MAWKHGLQERIQTRHPSNKVAYTDSNLFPNMGFNSHKYVNKPIHVSSIMEEGRKQGIL